MGTGRKNEGSVADHSEPGRIDGRLYDFNIDSDTLLLMHTLWLNNHVVPVLEAGGSVALTGLTSRSGPEAHNLKLSERRAKGVLSSLRIKVRGPVPYSLDPGYKVKSVAGVGESLAAQAGQKNGREDGFYRAVLVTAWHNPIPPPPPQPKPKPDAPKIKRITSRKWNKFNSRMQGEPGELGMEIGEIVNDVIAGVKDGGSDTRTYAMVPNDHVVTDVREDFIVIDDLGIGVNTTTYQRTIEYTWGPPAEWVRLIKRSKLIQNGRDSDWRVVRDIYRRNEIWKHVTGPDDTVYM